MNAAAGRGKEYRKCGMLDISTFQFSLLPIFLILTIKINIQFAMRICKIFQFAKVRFYINWELKPPRWDVTLSTTIKI